MNDPVSDEKSRIRREAGKRRRELSDRQRRNADVLQHLIELPEWQRAKTVLLFVGVKQELRTDALFTPELFESKIVAVPWCDGPELRLCRIESDAELSPGAFGIPEPFDELRTATERHVLLESCDLVLVPGVAFDRKGGRIGQGQGYYDRLLTNVREGTVLVSPAFECQLVPECPMEPHDRRVHIIVTENDVIRC